MVLANMILFASFFSPMDMAIIGVLAVLLFGDRLPQVMRAVGQGLTEFKKGMRDIEEQIESAAHMPAQAQRLGQLETHPDPTVPQFEPPAAEPQAEAKPGEPAQPA
jgi:sec-independent protein translocase protein TatA